MNTWMPTFEVTAPPARTLPAPHAPHRPRPPEPSQPRTPRTDPRPPAPSPRSTLRAPCAGSPRPARSPCAQSLRSVPAPPAACAPPCTQNPRAGGWRAGVCPTLNPRAGGFWRAGSALRSIPTREGSGGRGYCAHICNCQNVSVSTAVTMSYNCSRSGDPR